MKWWKNGNERRHARMPYAGRDDLIDEIWHAHRDWVVAQKKLDYALDSDQIDYAIYIIEAAEKRYEMLIKQAKQQWGNKTDVIFDKTESVNKTLGS